MKYKSKPFTIDAVQWTGKNYDAILDFTTSHDGFGSVIHTANFNIEKNWVEVFDYLQNLWIPVKLNDYIVKGSENEFYPCAKEVFDKKYEPVNGKSS